MVPKEFLTAKKAQAVESRFEPPPPPKAGFLHKTQWAFFREIDFTKFFREIDFTKKTIIFLPWAKLFCNVGCEHILEHK